jgi:hypothetical protein
MAKRKTGLGKPKKSGSHKTKKRLEKKYKMLNERTSKKSK